MLPQETLLHLAPWTEEPHCPRGRGSSIWPQAPGPEPISLKRTVCHQPGHFLRGSSFVPHRSSPGHFRPPHPKASSTRAESTGPSTLPKARESPTDLIPGPRTSEDRAATPAPCRALWPPKTSGRGVPIPSLPGAELFTYEPRARTQSGRRHGSRARRLVGPLIQDEQGRTLLSVSEPVPGPPHSRQPWVSGQLCSPLLDATGRGSPLWWGR